MALEPIEFVYPLSSMQQGMVFHHLYAPNQGVDIEQIVGTWHELLDIPSLQRAWEGVMADHGVLRTAFRLEQWQQLVFRPGFISSPWHIEDWRHLPAGEQQTRLTSWLSQDRQQGFDLSHPPLFRLALFQLADDQWHFVWTIHHALLDGRAFPIVLGQLFASYEALRRDQERPIIPRPAAYQSYIQWLEQQNLAPAAAFWQAYLQGFDHPTLLAIDHPAGTPPTYHHLETTIPAEELLTFAQTHQLSLNTLLQAAYALLLSRYSSAEEVMFGVTRSLRQALPDGQDMVGLLINTLPLRIPLPAGANVLPWLEQLRQQWLAQGPHAHAPLPNIQQWSNIPAGTPLFNSLLVYDNQSLNSNLRAQGGPWLNRHFELIEQPNYPLTIAGYLEKEVSQLRLKIVYNQAQFSPESIERLSRHLQTLLHNLITNPNSRLADLVMLTPAEQQQLADWNDTGRVYPTAQKPHQLFEQQANRQPQAIALVVGRQKISYAQLNQQANHLAATLAQLALPTPTLIAIALERSPELIAAILAAHKIGAAYLPIEPTIPAERLAYILEDSRAAVLLGSQAPAGWQPVAPSLFRAPTKTAPAANSLTQAAYVIYTSGSTGQPKGVLIPWAGLLNLIHWHNTTFQVSPSDRASHLAGLGFDASVWEMWPYLAGGATLYLVEADLVHDPGRLRDWLIEQAITITFIPTPLAEDMLELDWSAATSLRYLLTGGDKLSKYPPAGLPFELINNYGPTENSVVTTSGPISPQTTPDRPPTIGRPIANTQLQLLDHHHQPVPIGVTGELYIKGSGLFLGYLNHPSPIVNGQYQTGDLARYLPDGNLEFLGRKDNQVKIRGYRVELGEIETILSQHPAVHQAIVMAREDRPGNRQLIAYIVGQARPESLSHFLSRYLPNYMIPLAFLSLPNLPLTPNGKIDRAALPAPELAPSTTFVAPHTPLQEIIASHLADLLDRPAVGLTDDFFELGGNSLLATRFIIRLQKSLAQEIPVQVLFEKPTIAGLAAWLEEHDPGRANLTALPTTPLRYKTPLPLSVNQQGLWFLEQLHPASPTYNIPIVWKLSGPLDVATLESSLNALIERQPSLRTIFPAGNGNPYQEIQPFRPFHLAIEECPAGESTQIIAQFSSQPFDLSQGPLWRIRLLRLAAEQHLLLIAVHHIIADGWSIGRFQQELAGLYAGQPLLPLSVHYHDFVAWQSGWLREEQAARQIAFWKEHLAGSPPTPQLPSYKPRPTGVTFNGRVHYFTIAPELSAALTRFSRQESVTLFMTLLATFQLLLFRYTNEGDFVIAIPVANRPRPELEEVIGFFVNTLPLRANLSGNPTFRELLGRVRQVCLAAYSHSDIPLERIVQAVRPERHLHQHPLFQVMFALQEPAPLELPGLLAESIPAGSATAKFELTLDIQKEPSGLKAHFEYNSDLFEAAFIAQMADHFQRLLSQVVTGGDSRLADLSLLSEAERQRILFEWNQTDWAYPAGSSFQQQFAAQVAGQPNNIALLSGREQWTYAQLNGWAEQWAAQLHRLGLRPEMVVGVCLERTPAMLVALLAILKVGAAYLPLDLAYPAGRLAFMLDDSRAVLLLAKPTQAQQGWQPLTPLDEQVMIFAPAGEPPNPAPDRTPTPDNLAYILYTSGSTGRPKGVMVTQANLTHYLHWAAQTFFDDQVTIIPTLTRLTFDASLKQLLAPLLAGRPVWMLPDDILTRPEALLDKLNSRPNIGLNCVPAVWQVLVEALATRPERPDIRRLLLGGEAIPQGLLEQTLALLPGVEIWNVYGPTEATANAAIGPISPDAPLLIGRPIANTRLYILDEWQHPQPVGLPGELYIGGAGLSRGYINQPDLTAAAFVQLPGLGRLYRTGDIARYRPDGQIEWLRRADDQLKIRGFRVELGEIEAVIRRQPGVGQAAVIARDGQLLAYVVGNVAVKTLQQQLAQELPDYMLPAGITFLDQLPLTATGKIDRRNLPQTIAGPINDSGRALGPTEKILANIWSQTLGVALVGVEDNFFELGGHSLKALQLASRIGIATDRDISVKTLFQYPTVASLAERLPFLPLRNQGSPNLHLVQTPLLTLLENGHVGQLDAAALGYLGQPDSPYQQALYAAADGQPILNSITETPWGRFAAILLPRFRPELYSDPAGLVADVLTATTLAGRFGARIISLTGLIPSATDYGRAIVAQMPSGRPAISTGHATTTAAVVLSIERILAETGRQMAQEQVGVLGLGSIGMASLRLMLTGLPHPAGLLLCDVYQKREQLEAIEREVVEELGYSGPITILESQQQAPAEFYKATLIVGATNVPDILEVDLLRPGTLLVDDSGPHCFDSERAIGRLEAKQDILFTEGGVLQLPQLVKRTRFTPEHDRIIFSPYDTFQIDEADEVMGCAFSSTLSAHFTALKPTIGLVDLAASTLHYQTLDKLGFRGGSLRCRNYRLSPALIGQFRQHFGE